ncbi:hypothetical protein [Dehalococcoides mccartyi]|uniref:Histidine--tRNA ligase n=2 Tax=Dehalococcoides mccartyi TaxID=61435 RepID=A0AB33HN31_9CHLR|nr:hypothetical protein [Dehalococcoides mccartyi]BAS31189.1 hypothetical protein IBK_0114 [Dehalococcoides mccartyi IBARAKI]BAZ96714.1 hypothetical protein DEHALATV1_0086 [Dehalococcoides mccartyi]
MKKCVSPPKISHVLKNGARSARKLFLIVSQKLSERKISCTLGVQEGARSAREVQYRCKTSARKYKAKLIIGAREVQENIKAKNKILIRNCQDFLHLKINMCHSNLG